MANYVEWDRLVGLFRKASPNIAKAFDEAKRHSVRQDSELTALAALVSVQKPSPISLGTSLPARLAESPGSSFYVRTDGNDANSGTTNTAGGAWLTVGKATATLAAGQSAFIQAGNYDESLTLNHTVAVTGTSVNPISLIAQDAANKPVIRSVVMAGNMGYWRFRNLIFDPSRPGAGTPDAFKVTITAGFAAHHLEFDTCIFRNSVEMGLMVSGSGTEIPSYLHYINCMFRDNGLTGYEHGAYLQNIKNSLFANCIFLRNSGWGVHGYNSGSSASVRSSIFANCLAYGNVAGSGFAFAPDNVGHTAAQVCGDNDIVNCVAYDHNEAERGAFDFRNWSGTAPDILNRLTNCLGFDNSTIITLGPTSHTATNYLTSDPLFVNGAADDFTPATGSPCHSSGNAAFTPAYDYEGQTRTLATRGPLRSAAE